MTDEHQISQVLMNLVDNTATYVPPHTHITLSANHRKGINQIDIEAEEGNVLCKVRDVVFEAFRQEGRSGRRQRGAVSGLGTFKELVEAHCERLQIHSTNAPRTTISITSRVNSL